MIHLDEEPPLDIYEECVVRTMTTQGHVLLTMTPLLGMTDLCARFEQAQTGRSIVRAGWADAPHLSADDQSRMQQSLRPHEVAARRDGVPRLGHGLVYPIDEEKIKIPRFEIPETYKRAYGLDFGWSNPTAAVWGAYDDKDVCYIYDIYLGVERPPSEHARALRAGGDWIPGVCDPSGQAANQSDGISLMQQYADHGVVLTQADNSVESGIMTVLERMRQGKLKIFDDVEPLWREFRLYRRGAGGKIVKRDDHLMDALRYVIVSGGQLARTKPKPQEYHLPRNGWTAV